MIIKMKKIEDDGRATKVICTIGCITMLVIVFFALLVVLSSCASGYERENPRRVTYREKVGDTEGLEVWRNVVYEFVNVYYDTVRRAGRNSSTIEPEILSPEVELIPDDRVDLNDYLGYPGDGTDWNYTEIDSDAEKYLENLGIYWDTGKGYWRKK